MSALFPNQRFPLGQIVATPGVIEVTDNAHRLHCLVRHASGDWGSVCAEDAASNDEALRCDLRLISAYPIDPAKPCEGHGDNCFWIITEADRSVTTFLLSSEY